MKYVIDIDKPKHCNECPLGYRENFNDNISKCILSDNAIKLSEDNNICPLIPVVDIENTDGSLTRGYKEISVAKSLSEYKEKQMQNPEFREEYEKVIDGLRKEIQ